jgi:ribosomal protein S18 acetylase RimI-like enzyme
MNISTIRLRDATAEDAELLYRIYASTREEELSLLSWSEPETIAFLRSQSDAQLREYSSRFPQSGYQIIMLGDVPVGRFFVSHSPAEIRIVDLAILPTFRDRGFGQYLIREVLEEGERTGKPIRLHVEEYNRALRLYQRLGFVSIGRLGIYLELEWRSESTSKDLVAPDQSTLG